MSKGKVRKHNIDVMFLMILFLIFTFSAVSVLLMAVNSYKSVVYANEENANARTAIAYIREKVRQNDKAGAVQVDTFDGVDAIKLASEDGIVVYIYCYDGYLMEMETKEGAEVTADFGNKIMEVKDMAISGSENQLIHVTVTDTSEKTSDVSIAVKSGGVR
ncbi:protein of unknown function [Pseudobutyrivibrio sp. YE44]|uniref:DUF4860 domain-containing protein n=1 Tax=Pseudobutyrivibrio sp. YE44 TaxID=1520802 RepID=UPI000891689D|nr:DUF4860 domain-containing protein [Pseudobutyrivibrio sp. YE44]SDB28386.1 protein of unknown function [Pseudobutyrivibrio sp. YE44]